MNIVEATQINSFAHVAQQADVSPEEPIFVLTSTQLQEIISRAIQPLYEEARELKVIVANLEGKISALEATQDLHAENQFIQLQLINNLRDAIHKEPQPLQKDRGEILRALIAANSGKMLAKEARQKMRMDKGNFSRLLDTLKDYIDTKPLHQDKRKLLLIIK